MTPERPHQNEGIGQQVVDVARDRARAQRLFVWRSLMSMVVYVAGALMLRVGAALGLIQPAATGAAEIASVIYLIVPLTFYLVIRSGWSEHLADPALTLAQMSAAVVALALFYALMPAIRSSVLLPVVLVMGFGMFSLTPLQARALPLGSLAGFGVTMLALALCQPQVFDPKLEAAHFCLLAVVMISIALLSGHVAEVKAALRERKAAISAALLLIERLVRHDELTGLVNRRHMLERLRHEKLRHDHAGGPLSVCLVDLDHFKHINDSHGHAAGDEVLRRFATLAQQDLRSIDVLARWGGEEFLLLLPGTDASQASQTLERMRARLAASASTGERVRPSVTFSAGVAQWQPGESAEHAIERADRAAYRAKAAGRDRCEIDRVMPTAALPAEVPQPP